ncbi:MAG: hypothetical protein ABFS12_00920 [Bacteroidota bacterium]
MNRIFSLLPHNELDLEGQFIDCIQQLDHTITNNSFDYDQIVKLSIFVNAKNNIDYIHKKNEIETLLNKQKKLVSITPSIIGQPPQDKKQIALEVFVYDAPAEEIQIINKEYSGVHYVVVRSQFIKALYVGGITAENIFDSVSHQSKEVLKKMNEILKMERMKFSNVVRQWNFIESILQISQNGVGPKQNYQVFNDLRSEFYRTDEYKNGYPAATGIGMSSGGIILEFIAVSDKREKSIVPIKNPKQVDAHQYTGNVLVGDKNEIKTTPKFERAKAVLTENCNRIFISGTAAIVGEDTINDNSVEAQTETTIDNINALISSQNLNRHGISTDGKTSKEYIRVYVKNEDEIPKVKSICEKHWGNIEALYLISDICRHDLLVEIEGIGKIESNIVSEN